MSLFFYRFPKRPDFCRLFQTKLFWATARLLVVLLFTNQYRSLIMTMKRSNQQSSVRLLSLEEIERNFQAIESEVDAVSGLLGGRGAGASASGLLGGRGQGGSASGLLGGRGQGASASGLLGGRGAGG
jgi:hypothetical protein